MRAKITSLNLNLFCETPTNRAISQTIAPVLLTKAPLDDTMYISSKGAFTVYKKLSIICTEFFIKHQLIEKEKRDIHLYGFEILLSSLSYLLLFIAISILTNTFLASLCFFLGLFFIRKIAGGHHSKTYIRCHILFALNHLLFITLYYIIQPQLYHYIIPLIFLIAALAMWLLAPVDHKNKPFIKSEYGRYKTCSIIYGCCLIALLILLYTKILPFHKHVFSFSIGTISATLSLLIGKINRTKERKHHETNRTKNC